MEVPSRQIAGPKKLILRDTLALDRTKLANQRTLLSYIRTGIYLGFTGMGILQFNKNNQLDWLAWGFIMAGVLVILLGFFSYRRMAKKIIGNYE